MSSDRGGTPPDARLHRLTGELAAALAVWATRDDSKPQPEVRSAANTAAGTIDAMFAELYAVRRQLVGEIRQADDAAMARSEALLREIREDGQ